MNAERWSKITRYMAVGLPLPFNLYEDYFKEVFEYCQDLRKENAHLTVALEHAKAEAEFAREEVKA